MRATRALAAVAAAAVLVMGVDYATFAATGSSLILGHANRADSTTILTNAAGGPALRLKSTDAGAPALAVNNHVKVRRLNADSLDGRTASELASHAVTYKAGKRGDVVTGGVAAWALPVKPGVYQVDFKAVLIPASGTQAAPVDVICGLVNLATLGEKTRIFTADSATYSGNLPAAVSGAEVVRIRPNIQPALVCSSQGNTAPAPDFMLFSPATASFTRLTSRDVRAVKPVAPLMAQRAASGLREALR